MKKKFSFLVFFLFFSLFAFAQDIIFLRDNTSMKVKIIEIDTDYIIFTRLDNPNGDMGSLSKEDVRFIQFENGTKKYFNANAGTSSGDASISNSKSNSQDNNFLSATSSPISLGVATNGSISSENPAPSYNPTPQDNNVNVYQMRNEYKGAQTSKIIGEMLTMCGAVGVIVGIACASAGGDAEPGTIVALCSGVALSIGIPIWIVGATKMRNRQQYVKCFSKEFDCGDFALTTSVGLTRNISTNSNAPSVGLAFSF